MSHLISLDNIFLAFGLNPLLDHVKLQIFPGERVCLIGRNGEGKSSLMKIIEGSLQADSGMVYRDPHCRIARLAQELPEDRSMTVYDFVASGLAKTGELLKAYHALTHKLSDKATEADLLQLERLQQRLDAENGWAFEQRITSILTKLELNEDQQLHQLSGGWQRRAALAQALVIDPELLLLDEPTNHLDIEAIEWLENQLLSSNIGLLFITHDRALLQRLATRIVELDRGKLTSWPGDYQNFLVHKEELLHAEARLNAEFDKKLAREEVWIRQGIKARRTRNEGRVRALEALRVERSKRRELQGKANLNVNEGGKSGQLVVEAHHLTQVYGDKTVIQDFSVRIMRGDKIGLIGPNGVGKSTLLNILLGNLQPQQGKITLGTKLQIAYFDQLRKTLDPSKSVAENVIQGSEFIEINGRRMHIVSYLADFLFMPQRALTPVKALSGGECNRLLLAKLFSQPANLIVMDEPTNDLDIETLELLEELLGQYEGTLLLVSHDRNFLDNVVTSTLIFEGQGIIQEYVGGYQDWLNQAKAKPLLSEKTVKTVKAVTVPSTPKTKIVDKKLSAKEKNEYEALPKQIEELEAEIISLQLHSSTPEFYQQAPEKMASYREKLASLEEKLRKYYERWEELGQ